MRVLRLLIGVLSASVCLGGAAVAQGQDDGPPVTPPSERPANPRSIPVAARETGPSVPGIHAVRRADGTAAAPMAAPEAVKQMIWTANRLVRLRYRYGGGHRSFSDSAYDCSGAVSYALHAAGYLDWPMDSGSLALWQRPGLGRWVTLYANADHVFMVIAGLRLDTSAVADPGGADGPRWRVLSHGHAGFHRRHPAGL